jgi:hypothetical protein
MLIGNDEGGVLDLLNDEVWPVHTLYQFQPPQAANWGRERPTGRREIR